MLKVLQSRLQQYVNHKLTDVQVGFWKGRGTNDKMANIRCIIQKQEGSRKTSTFALLITPNPLIVWITTNWKILKEMEYQTTLLVSWETCMQVKKHKLELDVKQQTGSKSGKKYVKAVYCHPAYLTCRVHHKKCWTGWSTSWNQDCWEKYQ